MSIEGFSLQNHDNSPVFEQIQLRTLLNTTHTVEAVTTVERDASSILIFESLVAEGGDVDWLIVGFNGLFNSKMKLIFWRFYLLKLPISTNHIAILDQPHKNYPSFLSKDADTRPSCSRLRASPQTLPPHIIGVLLVAFLDGPEGIMQFANRSVERVTTQMERYREHSVFPPSNWMLHNYLLFTKLQLPTNTEIDAVDFLNGARFACDFAVNTMYSTEFVNFATGAISESPAAEKMKSGLSETCYDAFLFAMKQTSKTETGLRSSNWTSTWDRMSLAELKQEEALEAYNRAQVVELEKQEEKEGKVEDTEKVVVNPMEDISPEDHATMIERLRLDVQLDAVEHLEVVTAEAADQLLEKTRLRCGALSRLLHSRKMWTGGSSASCSGLWVGRACIFCSRSQN
ncbi:hypothetical protein GQ600_18923 [Phytophthora cactorum]|nr:hypothetical protein GQ600_18923 [Phytophthora cactorum]